MPPHTVRDLLFEALSLTNDGIGIFDPDDVLIYCNAAMADIYAIEMSRVCGMSFSQLIEHCFDNNVGLNVDTDDLQEWLVMAGSKRRSVDFRSFEVDLHDGRWFLITEQVVPDNHMLFYCSEITEKKKMELEMKRVGEILLEMASIDSLTKIYNRRHFQQLVEAEIERCRRNSLDAGFLMIDLDYFKTVNDEFGHAGGDALLQQFCDLVKQQLRQYDIFGRLGGEEFAVFLPETDNLESLLIAERIRAVVSDMEIDFDGRMITTSVSIGLSQFGLKTETLDSLSKAADEKLYRAKSFGRNRVFWE